MPGALWDTLVELTEPDPQRRLTLPDALARLAEPELAWHDGAAGEVEVFDHFAPEHTDEAERLHQSESDADGADRRLSTRDLLVFGSFGLLMILGIVLLLL